MRMLTITAMTVMTITTITTHTPVMTTTMTMMSIMRMVSTIMMGMIIITLQKFVVSTGLTTDSTSSILVMLMFPIMIHTGLPA